MAWNTTFNLLDENANVDLNFFLNEDGDISIELEKTKEVVGVIEKDDWVALRTFINKQFNESNG